jgi:nucleoside-diphosphate-sugar epimerase
VKNMDLAGKKVLISGIHGFLGANAVAVAVEAGADVLGIDLPGTSDYGQRVCSSICGKPAAFIEGDLCDSVLWTHSIEDYQPHLVLHCAGTTTRGFDAASWRDSVNGNYFTTSAMIEALICLPENRRPVVLHPGSQMEYGKAQMPWREDIVCKPFTPYGASKLGAAELLLTVQRVGMLKMCIGRIPILYGPGQSPVMFIPELISKALTGQPFKMTEGSQRRKFLFVSDAACVLLQIGLDLLNGKSVPSEPVSMKEVAQTLAGYVSENIDLQIGAIPSRQHEALELWPDDSMARSLGYGCRTPLKDGLAQTVQWYRNNSWFISRR